MINIAVCDDDNAFMHQHLSSQLKAVAAQMRMGINIYYFSDSFSLLNKFREGFFFDIVILDIEMPGINGKELANELRKLDNSFMLVYISSYPEEVFDTLKYKINSFIPKNSPAEYYNSELTRVFKEYSASHECLEVIEILRNGTDSSLKIAPSNILGFYLRDRNIYMKTFTADLLLKETVFKNISERFLSYDFFECSRNYLVNIKNIQEILPDKLLLSNGEYFPISRRKYKPLLTLFTQNILSGVE